MKAYLILEDGTVFEGTSIGSTREVISEIVFNTSMTGYLEVLTDPSYAGQAVVMTYPLIGNYGICKEDMESGRAWPDGYIVRELSRIPSNFRSGDTIQHFLEEQDIPGISGIDTRALTKILREKGTMNGMITTNGSFDLEEVKERIRAYKVTGVVLKTTTKEKYVLPGEGKKVALMDFGAKKNIARELNKSGCEVTVYPAGWGVWNYSGLPGNLLGQICPQYFVLWLPVALAGIILDDWIRYRKFGGPRPHYRLI